MSKIAILKNWFASGETLQKLIYHLKGLTFKYRDVAALQNLDLAIPRYTLAAISGPSGSGKSTLLNILGLIEPVQEGVVIFQDQDISDLPEIKKNEIRKYKIGFIFQQFHLIPVLTAEENISYFLCRQRLPKKQIKEQVHEVLNAVDLWEHRKKKPGELSGGQKQRVAIARAVAKNPEVIIADEPTASLDQATGREIMQTFEKLIEEKQLSIIISSHDPMVHSFAKHLFRMQDGRILC